MVGGAQPICRRTPIAFCAWCFFGIHNQMLFPPDLVGMPRMPSFLLELPLYTNPPCLLRLPCMSSHTIPLICSRCLEKSFLLVSIYSTCKSHQRSCPRASPTTHTSRVEKKTSSFWLLQVDCSSTFVDGHLLHSLPSLRARKAFLECNESLVD